MRSRSQSCRLGVGCDSIRGPFDGPNAGSTDTCLSLQRGQTADQAPRTLIGDSGILHTVLGLRVLDDVIPHPVAGPSWEGFVMEKLISAAPPQTDAFRYRTRARAGIDLLLRLPDRRQGAIGVERKSEPKLSKGFRIAAAEP